MNLRKPVIVLACLLFFSRCEQEQTALPQEQINGNEAGPAEAKTIAEHYASWENGAASRIRTVGDPTVFADDHQSPLFYAYNYKEGGFIIVSADKRAVPVLAFSDRGSSVDWKNAHEINGLKLWLNISKEKMRRIRASDDPVDKRVQKLWEEYASLAPEKGVAARAHSEPPLGCSQNNCTNSHDQWGPLLSLTVTWGQTGITNAFTLPSDCECGHDPAGCGPVAMGQVLRYYSPTSAFDYAAMPGTSGNSCGASTAGEQSLASLMVGCAVGASSVYHFGGCFTLTVPTEVPGGLEFLGMSNGGSPRDITLDRVANEVSSGHPVIMYGYDNIFTEWHIWVCDGARVTWLRSCEENMCMGWQYGMEYLNWGWDGSANGWYGSGDYSPGGENYDGGLKMIAGIRP